MKLFTGHCFAKIVQLIKPPLRSLQWKQTRCVYICMYICIQKLLLIHYKVIFSLFFNISIFSELEDFKNRTARQLLFQKQRQEPSYAFSLCTVSHYFSNFAVLDVSSNTTFTHPFFTVPKLLLHFGGSSPAAAVIYHHSQFSRAIAPDTVSLSLFPTSVSLRNILCGFCGCIWKRLCQK